MSRDRLFPTLGRQSSEYPTMSQLCTLVLAEPQIVFIYGFLHSVKPYKNDKTPCAQCITYSFDDCYFERFILLVYGTIVFSLELLHAVYLCLPPFSLLWQLPEGSKIKKEKVLICSLLQRLILHIPVPMPWVCNEVDHHGCKRV